MARGARGGPTAAARSPAAAGDVSVSLDATGLGTLSVTNVSLGTLSVDLGAPFGVDGVMLSNGTTSRGAPISFNVAIGFSFSIVIV